MTEQAPELDAPVVELPTPVLEDTPAPEPELEAPVAAHPLQPGGQRFEQVYARSKQAQRDLETERERRIKAEAQLELLQKVQPNSTPAAKEYAWDELNAMVATGQITQSDAYRHREEVLERKLASKLKSEVQQENVDTARITTLNNMFNAYLSAAPEIQEASNVKRQQVDREFDWLVSVQGKDASRLSTAERRSFEVTALRNVLGPVETLVSRSTPQADTHQGTVGGARRESGNPDQKLLNDLSPRQVEHYTKMMKMGKYKGWSDVVAELKYVAPRGR